MSLRGTHLRGSLKILCLLTTEICLLCPSICPRKLIESSSAALGSEPLTGRARVAPLQLTDSGALGLMQQKLMWPRHRHSIRQYR